jgi:hypothetical protein
VSMRAGEEQGGAGGSEARPRQGRGGADAVGRAPRAPEHHHDGALALRDHHQGLPDHERAEHDHRQVEPLEDQLARVAEQLLESVPLLADLLLDGAAIAFGGRGQLELLGASILQVETNNASDVVT